MDTRDYYKPFNYPWAYDAFVASEQMHWLWTEVPMNEDVKDWQKKLTDDEKDFLRKNALKMRIEMDRERKDALSIISKETNQNTISEQQRRIKERENKIKSEFNKNSDKIMEKEISRDRRIFLKINSIIILTRYLR